MTAARVSAALPLVAVAALAALTACARSGEDEVRDQLGERVAELREQAAGYLDSAPDAEGVRAAFATDHGDEVYASAVADGSIRWDLLVNDKAGVPGSPSNEEIVAHTCVRFEGTPGGTEIRASTVRCPAELQSDPLRTPQGDEIEVDLSIATPPQAIQIRTYRPRLWTVARTVGERR